MIEVVYKEEKKEAVGNEGFFRIPKNIRQIGEISAAHKIYMEDYAHTFLVRIADQWSGAKIGLLLGKANWTENVTYIFIKSALQIENMEVSPEHIAFTDEVWQQAEEKIEKYFPEQEIVGWFFIMQECTMELTDVLYRTHLNYFGGNDKLLYMMEPLEREEAFFQYENGCMSKQKGFYIYYDKNKPMQEYMIEMSKNIPIEDKDIVKDKAVQDFRKIISGKPEKVESEKGGFSLLHAVGACVVVGAIAVGVTYLNNYKKMEETSARVGQAVLQDKKATEMPVRSSASQETKAQEEMMDKPEEIEEYTEETQQSEEPREDATISPTPSDSPSVDQTEAAQEAQEGQAQDAIAQSEELKPNGSYVVQNGDTLSKISKRIYGNTSQVNNICKLNELNVGDIIYPGQIILLP
ncbi:MAG: LysM peptidoglycan-binding domain-containing protein [Lachnospiraceae bacterium]|nr:LysM peptidoglycan-binding domain-containing protein [Lachnospiraceae bacterium]